MNRSELQRNMIDAIVDGMDMEMLLACDALSATYDEYSDEELKNEVEEYTHICWKKKPASVDY